MVERGVIAGEEPILLVPGSVQKAGLSAASDAGPGGPDGFDSGTGFDQDSGGLNLDELERRAVRLALDRTSGNKAKAAGLLGISRQALDRKLEKHRL
jgi:DNA-binding NtrC family response regulator